MASYISAFSERVAIVIDRAVFEEDHVVTIYNSTGNSTFFPSGPIFPISIRQMRHAGTDKSRARFTQLPAAQAA